jgi:microsomal dipeptidase-like Zn-dependent dipeptidase
LWADHVMFGNDQDGLPQGAVISQLSDLRKVVEALAQTGLDEKGIRLVAFEYYERCVKTDIQNRKA